jgi:hypothetical protein
MQKNHRLSSSIKRLFLVAASLFCFLSGQIFLLQCSAQQNTEKEREDFLEAYVGYAFRRVNIGLIKVEEGADTRIRVQCLHQPCRQQIDAINKYVRGKWLKPIEVDTFDLNATVSVLLFSDPKEDDAKIGAGRELLLKKEEKIFLEGTDDCKVYGVVASPEIRRIVIVTNKNAPEKKLVSCVLVTLSRASGLVLDPNFERLWESTGELARSNDDEFDKIMSGTAAILALHFIPVTKPGMTQEEFRSAIKDFGIYDLVGEGTK